MAATAGGRGSWDIPIGVPVFTADGRKLGKVTEANIYGLVVEHGILRRHAYHLKLSDVERYEHGALSLKLTAAEVVELRGAG